MTYKQLLAMIKRKRKAEGSYRDFADRTGYAHSTMWGWESGRREITLRRFVDLAEALDYEVKLERKKHD